LFSRALPFIIDLCTDVLSKAGRCNEAEDVRVVLEVKNLFLA
jgi:hypothetical protein